MAFPSTKAARQGRIVDLLEEHRIRSQSELAEHLAADGIQVTQATLSRDLVEIGAERMRGADGVLVYAVRGAEVSRAHEPADKLTSLFRDLLITAEASGNIVMLRTPAGAAQFLASALDHTSIPEAIGTIAGDDTVMVVSRTPDGGEALARTFLEWSA
ncbi:arginine repressor [Rothia sp. AR01]|uniref:Arginine repressor n=1 Tax=Rothia santali TaxID=2949643 RepID=A0A9X2KGW6_9MICC|nr:arginine repressor [Rothia santali]MCP3425272.1 arginine repressor [Rothia santali]